MRYYICGQSGDGLTRETAFRPEIVDELPDGTSWAANPSDDQPPRFVVAIGAVGGGPTLGDFVVDDVLDNEAFDAALAEWALGAEARAEALHVELGYSPQNKDGFDWIEVADDGTVTIHAA